SLVFFFFFFQAEDGIRDPLVTGVQTCALPIFPLGPAGDDADADTPLRRPDGLRPGRHPLRGARPGRALRPGLRGVPPARARPGRSEERRVGKECRARWARGVEEKK